MPSSFDMHTLKLMDKAFGLSVTSSAANHPIEMALDFNPDTYWSPSSIADQDVIIDLGYGGNLISSVGDRDFSGATNWANNTLATFDKVTNLTVTSSAASQYCTLAAAGFSDGFALGKTYRIQYDLVERGGSLEFRTNGESIGTLVAGTNQTLDWTPTLRSQTELRVQSLASGVDSDVDNIAIIELFDDLTVNGWSMFLRDYQTNYGPTSSPRLNVHYSHDNNRWVGWNTGIWSSWQSGTNAVGNPIMMGSNFSDAQYRYFKFEWLNMAHVAQVAMFMLRRSYLGIQGNEFPETDEKEFFTKIQRSPGGRTFRQQVNSNPIWFRNRAWVLPADTHLTSLQAVHDGSLGAAMPLILEEPNTSPAELVRLDSAFKPALVAAGMYRPEMNFRTVPYINPDVGF